MKIIKSFTATKKYFNLKRSSNQFLSVFLININFWGNFERNLFIFRVIVVGKSSNFHAIHLIFFSFFPLILTVKKITFMFLTLVDNSRIFVFTIFFYFFENYERNPFELSCRPFRIFFFFYINF